jgi:hypothetical protein
MAWMGQKMNVKVDTMVVLAVYFSFGGENK